ncbi:MAG: FtsW/RodA/SpoVE family cell cycle protein, partial [Clostridiales bacterium]|nr:FtsW/RodA/SpoVE family cell cycle protein [Clostridiales bacterium]
MLFSASYVFADSRTGDSLYYIRRHIIFLVIGGFAALFGFLWPYTIYKKYAEIIFIVVCVTLVAVLLVGVSEGSAVRWIDFKLFTFQPSDAMKFSI